MANFPPTKSEYLLFIAGDSPRSDRAVQNLKSLQELLRAKTEIHIQIVDIFKNPQLAEKYKVLSTPSLVRTQPPPICRIIGDLSNPAEIAKLLE